MSALIAAKAVCAAVLSSGSLAPVLAQDPKGATQNPNYFNPHIGIVGDFAANLRKVDGERRADFREIEFGFAADADPFLRVEAYIAIANEDGESVVEVEEAFGKYSRLGRGMSAKFGKFAAAVGRVQRNHSDQLGYLDYPLVIQDTLGDEGFRRPGGSISYLFPGDRFHELTVEVLDAGDKGAVFNDSTLDKPVLVGHYRTFLDFNEDLSASVGASIVSGPTLGTNRTSRMTGIDLTMKHQPAGGKRQTVFVAESYWTRAGGGPGSQNGWFVRVMHEVTPRFWLTVGYDKSAIPGTSDWHRGSLFGATLKVTEFHHWRIECQRLSSNFEGTRSMLNLQFQWVIGAHPAHKY